MSPSISVEDAFGNYRQGISNGCRWCGSTLGYDLAAYARDHDQTAPRARVICAGCGCTNPEERIDGGPSLGRRSRKVRSA